MDSKFLTPYDVCTAISPNPFSKLLEIGAATSDLSFGCTSERNFVDVRTNIEVPVFSDLHQERLKIDRKKLEHMITGKSINIFEFGERKITVLSDNEAQESVVAFFNRVSAFIYVGHLIVELFYDNGLFNFLQSQKNY